MLRWILGLAVIVLVVGIALQFVSYGRDHTNPPVTKSIAWDTPRTAVLAMTSCYDCHSNLTDWPWYSKVAPFSWLVYRDVEDGREHLNFSEWDTPQADAAEILNAVQGGSMPPRQYTLVHRAAGLSDAERAELVRGLQATLDQDPPVERREDD